MPTQTLFYGDNLDILRQHIPDESVDLIYLDPPFNSKRDYNVIFKDESGLQSDAQLFAFDDTWHWGPTVERHLAYLTTTARHRGAVPSTVSTLISALVVGLGKNQMMAYLVEMTIRLIELRRVLKHTGSLYLHCDPTASHYLKVMMDAVFGSDMFRNEIVWQRTGAHGSAKRFGPIHDTLLFYTRGKTYTWNPAYMPLPQETVDEWFNNVEAGTGRRFNRNTLTAPGVRAGSSGKPWRGVDPTAKGRHWAVPGFAREIIGDLDTIEALEALDKMGRVFWPKKAGGTPMLKLYLDEAKGVPALDVWTDIRLQTSAKERLGYQTQKPRALLERIIEASSNKGDVVLDPFCGCGTTIAAAQMLERSWIGIDITYPAIKLIRQRLEDMFGNRVTYRVIGEPVSVADAKVLAATDPYQFQWWALDMVGAVPLGGEKKKGKDRGIDGMITFPDRLGRVESIIVSVKGGKVNPGMVRDLRGVVERDKAAMGVFVTLRKSTAEMRLEATKAGEFTDASGRDWPRIQILTIDDLLNQGKSPQLPAYILPPYRRASRVPVAVGVEQASMFDEAIQPIEQPPVPYPAPVTRHADDSLTPGDDAKTPPKRSRGRRPGVATG